MTTATTDYSRAAYERDEARRFRAQLDQVEKAPLSERKEGRDQWAGALRTPEIVAERIGWLLNGSYGRGSYCAALVVIGNPRMNVKAWLGATIAAIEWRCPGAYARAAWKTLTPDQQTTLADLIQAEIDYKVAEMEENDA